MINEQLQISDSKAEIPVAERERDAATENKVLQHVLSIGWSRCEALKLDHKTCAI